MNLQSNSNHSKWDKSRMTFSPARRMAEPVPPVAPTAPSVAKAVHSRSAVGTYCGGSRAFAPRLSPRSSSSGVPPVVLGSHSDLQLEVLTVCCQIWQILGVDRGRVVPGLAFRAAAWVNGR